MAFSGLALIALGTGGIKLCVAAFGDDQFKEHQVKFPFHFLFLCQCWRPYINTVNIHC